MEAADILAAHGDHEAAVEHLDSSLRSPTHPDLPSTWALKPSEQQRLHSLWMKQGTLEACEKVSVFNALALTDNWTAVRQRLAEIDPVACPYWRIQNADYPPTLVLQLSVAANVFRFLLWDVRAPDS